MKLLDYSSLLLKTPALLYCSVTGRLTKHTPYRLVTYFGVREVVKTEVLSRQVEESEGIRYD